MEPAAETQFADSARVTHPSKTVQAGAVNYQLMHATMPDILAALRGIWPMLERIEATMDWRLGVPYWTPPSHPERSQQN